MILALLLAQAAAGIPVPPLPCTRDAALPPVLAFWSQPAAGTALGLFRPVVVPAAAGPLPKGAKPGKLAGAAFAIAEAGDYTIATGAPGWIDVAPAGGEPLVSIAHDHGPACTSISKLVSFHLAVGTYRLTVSGLAVDQLKVALVPGNVGDRDGKK